MKPKYALSRWMLLASLCFIVHGPQSLVELAKKEAERRKLLEQQGIEAKTIQQGDAATLAPNASISTSSIPPSAPVSKAAARNPRLPSVEKVRSGLQKLDAEIRRTEERLASARKRLEVEKAAPIRLGRMSKTGGSASQLRLQNQVQELEAKLKRLRDDRLKSYDAARRSGFLPGDLKP